MYNHMHSIETFILIFKICIYQEITNCITFCQALSQREQFKLYIKPSMNVFSNLQEQSIQYGVI